MIEREQIWEIVENYDVDRLKLGATASHCALDVCDGAADEGLPNLAICQKGREKTYETYFRTHRDAGGNRVRGYVDEAWVFDSFNDVMRPDVQKRMRDENVLFVPNRSFTSYSSIDDVESKFNVPLIGSRNLLRSEERSEQMDYYWLLEKAGMPFPEKIESPEDINELCIVKLHHAQKKLERGFFTASTPAEFNEKAETLLKDGVITRDALADARIERYVIGPVFNFDFFYSPVTAAKKNEMDNMSPLELLGVDWRFETSLDGHVRLPAPQQMTLPEHQLIPEMTVCGHNSATVRESLLEKVFRLGEMYVEATREHYGYPIVGPFCLQTCVDKNLNFYIYDVAPRVGGGTNVHVGVGHPYGNSLWRRQMSTGARVAHEVKRAVEHDCLKEIVS